jgi:hypothetical protein
MRNRAKCKLCNDIIESMHSTDLQACKCGQIYVDGGDALTCGSYDWNNFLRVDDEGNEIIPKIQEKDEINLNQSKNEIPNHKPSKKEMLDMLDEMIKSYENLPQHAMLSPVTHADFVSLLLLLSSIFRS